MWCCMKNLLPEFKYTQKWSQELKEADYRFSDPNKHSLHNHALFIFVTVSKVEVQLLCALITWMY